MKSEPIVLVYFWNHRDLSPGVLVRGEALEVANLVYGLQDLVRKGKLLRPEAQASLLTHWALVGGLEAEVYNAPLGPSLGITLQTIHRSDNAPGGGGCWLVDLASNEVQIFGGSGPRDAPDYNLLQVRIEPLRDPASLDQAMSDSEEIVEAADAVTEPEEQTDEPEREDPPPSPPPIDELDAKLRYVICKCGEQNLLKIPCWWTACEREGCTRKSRVLKSGEAQVSKAKEGDRHAEAASVD